MDAKTRDLVVRSKELSTSCQAVSRLATSASDEGVVSLFLAGFAWSGGHLVLGGLQNLNRTVHGVAAHRRSRYEIQGKRAALRGGNRENAVAKPDDEAQRPGSRDHGAVAMAS